MNRYLQFESALWLIKYFSNFTEMRDRIIIKKVQMVFSDHRLFDAPKSHLIFSLIQIPNGIDCVPKTLG